jgi:glutamyl-tRNA reductase
LHTVLENYKVIAFTHKNLPLSAIGKLHLPEAQQRNVLAEMKQHFGFSELMYLNTCNRVELIFRKDRSLTTEQLAGVTRFLNGGLDPAEAKKFAARAECYSGDEAVDHVFRVASSLESMVAGEREIFSQIRKSYERSREYGLTADSIRLLMRATIETAKEVFTRTRIAHNPVSVASLAFRLLRSSGLTENARILIVGSGETNTTLASYFRKHHFRHFTVFNRTLSNARKLAGPLGGEAYTLSEMKEYRKGFDAMLVCVTSPDPLINSNVFDLLRNNESGQKLIIDLGVPANVTAEVAENPSVKYIDITSLKKSAAENLKARKGEVEHCEAIISARKAAFSELFRERTIERAFSDIPASVKSVAEFALNDVFAGDLKNMDAKSRETVKKVVSYMEKKFNAIAMKKAKQLIAPVTGDQ